MLNFNILLIDKVILILLMIGMMFCQVVKNKEWQWQDYFIINLYLLFLMNVQVLSVLMFKLNYIEELNNYR